MATRKNTATAAVSVDLIEKAGADVEALVKSIVSQVKADAKAAGSRQATWDKLAPMQFADLKLKHGLELEKGPLVDAAVKIAAAFSDKGQKNDALSKFRVEVNRALGKVMGWESDDKPFSVGFKAATKQKQARLVFKAKGSQTADEALAGLIKVYGIDDLSAAIMRNGALLAKVAEDIKELMEG